MDMWFAMFGVFAIATVIALVFNVYLIAHLKSFPEEYRKAGSPSVFWNDGRTWSFLGYVLRGTFAAIPDANLVGTFKAYRVLETFRLTLVAVMVLSGLTHDIFFSNVR